MRRHFQCILALTALLLGAGTFTLYPLTAAAQQPQDPHMFDMRMSSRINAVQMRIKRLENEFTGESSGQGRPSEYDADSGMLRRLEELDKQCRELKREVDSLSTRSIGSPSFIYEQQRRIEYYVWGLENQVEQIGRSMRSADEEVNSSVEPPPQIDTEEDGISDEDWAADWARGDTQ